MPSVVMLNVMELLREAQMFELTKQDCQSKKALAYYLVASMMEKKALLH
jgi:hypothetical protein